MLLSSAVCADDSGLQRYRIDPTRSSAEFSVAILWLMRVHGDFPQFTAELVEQTDGRFVVNAVLDARSVRMRRDEYSAWARSPEFFDAERHPEIRFRSDPFSLDAIGDKSQLRGELRLRGRSDTAVFSIRREACQVHPCPVQVQGSVRRSAFGMSSRRTTVGDRVRFRLSIEWLGNASP